MKTSEFRCLKCDYLFEIPRIANEDWPDCPVCEGETVALWEWPDHNPDEKIENEKTLELELIME